ncbi:MAG TPA: hypothetical protein VGP07_23360 [Polyangia bacterium]
MKTIARVKTTTKVRRTLSAVLVAGLLALAGGIAQASAAAQPGADATGPGAAAQTAGAPTYSTRTLVSRADSDLAAGHPGRAILGYERARLLAPRSPVIAADLARARASANLPSAPRPIVARAFGLLSANEWGALAIAALLLAFAALVSFAWARTRRRLPVVIALVAGMSSALAVGAAWHVTPPPGRAVVVAADTTALVAPFTGAEAAFVVPEGALVTVERTRGDFTLIADGEGQGWVPRAGVETILLADDHHS